MFLCYLFNGEQKLRSLLMNRSTDLFSTKGKKKKLLNTQMEAKGIKFFIVI